jgi:hypothetical protein
MAIYNGITYIEHKDDTQMIDTPKHNYIRFRLGRLKHAVWLRNRKSSDKIYIDCYDKFILDNIQPGKTCMFGSAGYYLGDLVADLYIVEQWEIVKQIYPDALIVDERTEIADEYGATFSNFVVNNNKGDRFMHGGPTDYCIEYTKSMTDGCLFFYSFRDTQQIFNRLKVDQVAYFYNWASSLRDICGLYLLWHQFEFVQSEDGMYNELENPDTTNGNLKFVFQYNDDSYKINDQALVQCQ